MLNSVNFWEVGNVLRSLAYAFNNVPCIVAKAWSIRQISQGQKKDIREGIERHVTGPKAMAFWSLAGSLYWSHRLGDPMDPDSGVPLEEILR